MSELIIVSNYHRRPILYGWELTDQEKADFSWIDNSDTLLWEDAAFFRYKGDTYCLLEFMRTDTHPDPEFQSWDEYSPDTFFSGILVRYLREDCDEDCDTEYIIVAFYYVKG